MAKNKSFSFPKHLILPLVVGIIPMVVAYFISTSEQKNEEQKLQNMLETRSEQITNRVQQRGTDIILLVKEITDLFGRGQIPSKESWEKRIELLNLEKVLQEIELLGVLKWEGDSETTQILRYQNSLVSPDSYEHIFEKIKSNTHYNDIIEFHQSELNRSIEQGTIFTPLFKNSDMGFIYFPIFDTIFPPDNIEDRYESLIGISFLYTNLNEFFDYSKGSQTIVDFSIIRSTKHQGLIEFEYDRENYTFSPLFRYKTIIPIFNETWVVNFYSLKDLEEILTQQKGWITIISGATIGMLLFSVFYLISSGRKRAMQLAEHMTSSLRKSEENFRNSFDWTSTGMVVINPDLKCGKSNRSFQKITGYSSEEIDGLNIGKLITLDKNDEGAIKKAYANKLQTFHSKRELKRKDKEKIWIAFNTAVVRDQNHKLLYFIINIDDITEELKSQEAIKHEQKRLRLTVDSFKIAVWDWDPATDAANWDKLKDDFLGIDPKNAKKRSMSMLYFLMHPDDRAENQNVLNNAVAKKSDFDITYRVIHADESVRIINSKGMAVPASNKLGVSYFGISFDVTEEKALEQLKSNFVSIASHQLRTPLTAIRWFLQMITDNVKTDPLSEKQGRLINKVDDSSQRMLALVNDLLSVSRLETKTIKLNPIKLSIEEVTRKIMDDVTVSLNEKKQKIELSSKLKNTNVISDRTMTEQVIQNLVTNANKYSPDKAIIKIQITGTKTHIRWAITNKGIPITEQDRSKLFQQFFRSTEASQSKADGSGLGLYISKAIVEMSGGEIECISNKKDGTTFAFTLPKSNTPKKRVVSKKVKSKTK